MVTKEEIRKLGLTSPLIGHFIMAHEHNGLDWWDALALMVWHLNEANQSKDKIIAKLSMMQPAPPIFLERPK